MHGLFCNKTYLLSQSLAFTLSCASASWFQSGTVTAIRMAHAQEWAHPTLAHEDGGSQAPEDASKGCLTSNPLEPEPTSPLRELKCWRVGLMVM